MGAGASVGCGPEGRGSGADAPEASQSDVSLSSANSPATTPRLKKPSLRWNGGHNDVALEVLKDPRWCSYFKEYINHALEADFLEAKVTSGTAEKTRELAMNYLQFWLDVSDWNLLSDSGFRALRADGICERFLTHGAKQQIPLGQVIVDDILTARDKDSAGAPPRDMFQAAQEEAYEYLELEVFPLFSDNHDQYGFEDCLKRIRMTDRARRQVDLTSTDNNLMQALSTELSQLLEDPVGTKFFKDYMERSGVAEILLFYLEALDFKTMFEEVLQDSEAMSDSKEKESKGKHAAGYFLMRANKLYDKHLKLGSTLRGVLSERDIRNVVDLISSPGGVTPDVFDALSGRAFELMILDHFMPFKESAEKQLLGAEISMRQARLQTLKGDHKAPTLADSHELKDMLQTNAAAKFQAFLNQYGEGPLLMFYHEIEDFRNIPVTQAAFVQGRASKIFERFIKRGAPMELRLPSMVRCEIVRRIDSADLALFNHAQEKVFDILLKEHFMIFKQTSMYGELVKELSNKPTVSTDRGGTTPRGAVARTGDLCLDVILADQVACTYFKKFTESEFCLEPLLFWLDVEEYKRLPRSEFLQTRSRKIINRYLKDGATLPIKISAEARAQVMERTENPGPTTFHAAQAEMATFMDTVLLPKFRKTEEYHEMLLKMAQAQNAKVIPQISVEELKTDEGGPGHQRSPSEQVGVTLKEVLRSSAGIRFFKEYLLVRHCEENLMFWLEAEDFKNIPGTDYLKVRANKIVAKYIEETAKQQINIDHNTRTTLLKQLEDPNHHIFKKAQEEVLMLMTRDSWPGFLTSEQYEKYKELAQDTQATSWRGILKKTSSFVESVYSPKQPKPQSGKHQQSVGTPREKSSASPSTLGKQAAARGALRRSSSTGAMANADGLASLQKSLLPKWQGSKKDP